jgi:hypothetical protein
VVTGIGPHFQVRRPIQPQTEDMAGPWVHVGKAIDLSGGEIVIEEQPHVWATSRWRSRSAA